MTGFAPKLRTKPKGTPVAVRATGDVKPPKEVIVTVASPIVLGPTITLAGERRIAKSPDDTTFKVSVVECVIVPFDPVTMNP